MGAAVSMQMTDVDSRSEMQSHTSGPDLGNSRLDGPTSHIGGSEIPPMRALGRSVLLPGALWTIGGYAVSTIIKLASNVLLSRLLAPDIFGIMVIANSFKLGIELLTDVGIEQNIVHHRDGLEDAFFNTAWTLQIIRGCLLTSLFLCLAVPLAKLYGIAPNVLVVTGFAPLVNALHSTSIFLLVKNMEVRRRNLFELGSECITFVIYVALALITQTVWALVVGALLSLAARSTLSYIIPHPTHRLTLSRPYVRQILRFGKWILVLSFVMYAANNLDRIYLGKLAPLSVLGVYSLARTISELPSTLASRLSYQVVFPFFAATTASGELLRKDVFASTRWKFILLASLLLATAIAWADMGVYVMYDRRYHEAGWMLFLLLIGGWVSLMSNLNEAVVLGFGRPAYNSVANGVRLATIAIGIPLGYHFHNLLGACVAIIASEISRYVIVAIGLERIRFSFLSQDGLATSILCGIVICWFFVREMLGLGAPWDAMLRIAAKGL